MAAAAISYCVYWAMTVRPDRILRRHRRLRTNIYDGNPRGVRETREQRTRVPYDKRAILRRDRWFICTPAIGIGDDDKLKGDGLRKSA